MKKYINLILVAVLAMAFGACSKDNPFDIEQPTAYGKLLTASLDVSLNENGPREVKNRKVRMGAPSKNLFTVEILKDGAVVQSYLFSEMPEIITLPVGEYTARAYYGENLDQSWDTPYYEGETENTFKIEADKITEKVDPIVCRIVSVRVSVDFDPALKAVMDASSKVTVVVGKKGTLEFDLSTVGKSGYFAFVEDSRTLAATFEGIVEGDRLTESKAFDNVEPGKFYEITFRLHTLDDDADPGNINGDDIIHVDATVQSSDIEGNVTDEDDEVIDEGNMRPSESDPAPDEPGIDEPVDPSSPAPEIVAHEPYDIDSLNELIDDTPVVVDITSVAEGGIKAFTVDIKSDKLDKDQLESVHLSDHLDLVNPGEFAQALGDLGLPYNVGGKSNVQFEITAQFIMLLRALGDGNHNFVLTVTDANGTTVKQLRVHSTSF